MKKQIFISALMLAMFTSCFEGVEDREKYIVSGYVYCPDSTTTISNTRVSVTDVKPYVNEWGLTTTEMYYSDSTDENGYFEIVIPDGGKIEIRVMVNTQPDTIFNCDTAEVMYQYRADTRKVYRGKHSFENLQIYSDKVMLPHQYPYCDPSVPYIGDSCRIVAMHPIYRVELIEERTTCIFAMDYQEPDTSVMFFIPDFVSIEKYYSVRILVENGVCGIPLHLRQHNNNIQKPSLQ